MAGRTAGRFGRTAVGAVSAAAATFVLAGPAAAHATQRAAVVQAVNVTGAECNVVSASYCLVNWPTADGTFVATGVHADGSTLMLDGLFTGRRMAVWPWINGQFVDVKGQQATVPVGTVTVTRRAVVLRGADWPSNCGVSTAPDCTISTNAIKMIDTSLGDAEPMSYRERPFTVTGHPSSASGKHAVRDWRRARSAAARAAVLQRLLFPR
jgi:hypothetical protein